MYDVSVKKGEFKKSTHIDYMQRWWAPLGIVECFPYFIDLLLRFLIRVKGISDLCGVEDTWNEKWYRQCM